MKKVLLLTTLAVILLLSACGTSSAGKGYTDISVSELQTMMEDKDFLFVNTHIPFQGDIPDTDLTVPYNQIDAYIDQLPEDKNAKIVLYCRSGSMSTDAAQQLVALGYTNVYELDGGFNAWKAAGLPMDN